MIVDAEKKFAVEIVYNGVTKSLQVEPEERVSALLQKAIATFGITQQQHLLSLFRQDGTVVPEDRSVEAAGLKPGEILLLRPNAMKGGGLIRLAGDVITATFERSVNVDAGNVSAQSFGRGQQTRTSSMALSTRLTSAHLLATRSTMAG